MRNLEKACDDINEKGEEENPEDENRRRQMKIIYPLLMENYKIHHYSHPSIIVNIDDISNNLYLSLHRARKTAIGVDQ